MKLYNHWCKFCIGDDTPQIVKRHRGEWCESLDDVKLDLEKDLLWIKDNIKNVKNISGGIEDSDFNLRGTIKPKTYKCDACRENCDGFIFTFLFRQESRWEDGSYILGEKEYYLCSDCKDKVIDSINKCKIVKNSAMKTGQRYGIFVEDKQKAKKFIDETFNEPESIKITDHGFIYQYENGDTVEWISPCIYAHGNRYDKVFIHKAIPQDMAEDFLEPSTEVWGVKYFD